MDNELVNEIIKKTSPIEEDSFVSNGHTLMEATFVGKINLRGDIKDVLFSDAVTRVLGGSLPSKANTFSILQKFKIFWLGPDEWLIYTPEDQQIETVDLIKATVGDIHCAVTDVSDYYTVLELRGALSDKILARGCTIDLYDQVFKKGQCVQTIFANAPILLSRSDKGYDIQVRWTFSQYVWKFIIEATNNTLEAAL